jgi:predicted ester cyclase
MKANKEAAMSSEQNIERMRRLVEDGIGRGDLAVIEELVHPDCVEHQRGNHPGVEGAKEVATALHRWMSGFSLTVEDVVAAGDLVWTRNRARGVNTGSVMGNPPTGARVEVDVFDVGRFENGRLVEHWGVADQVGLLMQVGAMPGRPAGVPG